MARQQHKQPQPARTADPEPEAQASTVSVALADEVDDLLAEIDNVLEENAEAFVRSYIQDGGQ